MMLYNMFLAVSCQNWLFHVMKQAVLAMSNLWQPLCA